ncbi:hypothetical protein [Microbacterium dauci]|uniref:Uncharacterized protein n=1 Tax=Microbacterium dauci TaxID=3048008 RepID=A0ABT6ZGX2_9MICO|nr:hypothetical protein [Microbacterium sp. LX3-4]MDJ1115403.1 hypothetical protein [Microbacterium sp. LX3-4]
MTPAPEGLTVVPEPSFSTREIALAGLADASQAIRRAIDADDEASILTRTAEALGHLYALWSAYGVNGKQQVAWAASDVERRNVVAMVYVRGEVAHRGVHAAMAVGFGEGPYGVGPFGGGWLWRECPARPGYEASAVLYEEQALWCWVYEPLERALAWFATHEPPAR